MKQPIPLLTATFVLTTTLHISTSGKVSNMNSDHSDTQARDKASSAFSRMFIIGTDVAAWFIFHPDDLVHRKDDPITAAEWRQLNRLNRLPDADFPSVVITHSFAPQAIGSLFRLNSYGTSLGLKPKSEYEMTGMGQRFVQLVKTFERGGMQWAEVKPYDIPPTSAQQAIIDKLKTLFAEYASKNTKYRERVPHPSFYAERVAALQEPLEILWAVANALALSPEQTRDLLNLSEQDLAEKLRQMLETKSK